MPWIKAQVRKIKRIKTRGGFSSVFFSIRTALLNRVIKYIIIIKSKFSSSYVKNPFEVKIVKTKDIKFRITPQCTPKLNRSHRFIKTPIGKCRYAGKVTKVLANEAEPIHKAKVFLAMQNRFQKNKTWEETFYYQECLKQIKNNKNFKGFNTWEEYKKKVLTDWDKLYENIKNNGYSSQKQLNGSPTNEIEVAIADTGDILLIDGIHRYSICCILQIAHIPVIINLHHG